jgi:hypothetical protein
MSTFQRAVLGIVGLAASAMTANAAVVLVDFNTPTDLATNFIQNNNGTPSVGFANSLTGGIKDQAGGTVNGGAVVGTGADMTAVFQGNGVDVTAGPTLLSIITKVSAVSGATRVPELGFLNRNNRSFNAESADTAFIAPRLNSGGTVELQTKLAGAVSNVITTAIGSVTGYTAADYYQIIETLTPTNAATGAYTLTTQILDLGPDGTAAGTQVFLDSNRAVTNAAFSTAVQGTTATVGFRTNGNNPAGTFDNFSVNGTLVATPPVPEPSGLALLGLGIAAFARRRR